MIVEKVCKVCGKSQIINISREEYDIWKSGVDLIEAAPHLTADEREIMIYSICGTCFDTMFNDED